MKVDMRRVRPRNEAPVGAGMVVYWMERDQRALDNWALLYAQEQAVARGVTLCVVFNLVSTYGHATHRQYDFMLRGLAEVESTVRSKHIPFYLLQGNPADTISKFVKKHDVGEVVTDQNPLRDPNAWREQVGRLIPVRLTEVDAHNIVPVWFASPKEEFAAYTFRPKITRLLPEFLTEFPRLQAQSADLTLPAEVSWDNVMANLETDRSVVPVSWLVPGAHAADTALKVFCEERLSGYDNRRNDPNEDGQSDLSPYFHFGQLSPQRAALMVRCAPEVNVSAREAYLEELIVRRELADNYCFYNNQYDTIAGAHAWAQKTIAEHADDVREFSYSRSALDAGKTHDELWNAMQSQLTTTGKLHGWCRMYWAKKILEWTPDTQTAIDTALYLNDRYELDGHDPNGVVGVMWSIAGVHDRAWNTRSVFGKIRYMNYAGAKRKFDIKAYIARYDGRASLFHD
ncbi:deoxyribodipyrimidine photo-lyase [Patescibacteria group bacterium]|nr:deoxyribodipyrimidine photo-lyase [Patescibacteria group bacterium]